MSRAHPNTHLSGEECRPKGKASAASSAGGAECAHLEYPRMRKNRLLWFPHLNLSSQAVGSMGYSPGACHPQSRSLLSLPATLTWQATASGCPGRDTGSTVTSQLYIPSHHRHQQGSQPERAVQSDGKQCANEAGNFTNPTKLKKTRMFL